LKKLFLYYKLAYSGLPKAAWMLAFVVLVNRSGSIILFFMTLYLTQEMDYSVAAAGRMISVYGIGAMVGAYSGGWLSDIIGTKKVQLLSLIFSGISFIILGYLKSPIVIAVSLFIIAVLNESFRPANATAVGQVTPPEMLPRGFALNRLAVNIGVTIGPAIGGFLALYDYTLLFWFEGLTCLAAAMILRIFFREASERYNTEPKANTLTRSPWKDTIFLFFLILTLICGLMFVQLFNTWPLYMKEFYGLFENEIGILLALNAALIVLIEMPLIHRIEQKSPLNIISIGTLLLFGGFTILPFGKGMFFGAVTVIIWTFGEMLIFPLAVSFVAKRASARNRGKYMGLYVLSFALAFVIGPALGTAIYDSWGANSLWLSGGLLGLLVSLGFFVLGLRLKKDDDK
jgi:predicted MFS family arabinose efflux permease